MVRAVLSKINHVRYGGRCQMFKDTCICCQKALTEKKQCFEVSNSTMTGRYICRECAAEIGIKNFFSAGIHSKTSILKKYVKLHPERQDLIDKHSAAKKEMRDEFSKELNRSMQHAGCTEKVQEKYTCLSCQNVWYISDIDHVKNLYNFTRGNVYSMNQMKDVSRCPKCGSSASKKEKKKYWLDKNGNCVDAEQ